MCQTFLPCGLHISQIQIAFGSIQLLYCSSNTLSIDSLKGDDIVQNFGSKKPWEIWQQSAKVFL